MAKLRFLQDPEDSTDRGRCSRAEDPIFATPPTIEIAKSIKLESVACSQRYETLLKFQDTSLATGSVA